MNVMSGKSVDFPDIVVFAWRHSNLVVVYAEFAFGLVDIEFCALISRGCCRLSVHIRSDV